MIVNIIISVIIRHTSMEVSVCTHLCLSCTALMHERAVSSTEAQLSLFLHCTLQGMISVLILLQDFKACLRSPDLALCRKDINVLLGEVDEAPVDYQALTQDVYQLLSSRLAVRCLNGHQP